MNSYDKRSGRAESKGPESMPIDDNCGRHGGGTQKHSVPACLSEEVHKELMHKTTLTRRLIAVSNQGLKEEAIEEIGAVKPAANSQLVERSVPNEEAARGF